MNDDLIIKTEDDRKHVPEGQKELGNSVLPFLIERIEGRIKHIPKDQIAALETVEMMLNVINIYAKQVADLKSEMNKCAALNQKQAEMLRNKGIVDVGR